MYPSGVWRGFWEQTGYGRQPMADFRLTFRDGVIDGSGKDVIGPFVFRGACDTAGRVRLVKQYLGGHRVLYVGGPDGEGSITGTWAIDESVLTLSRDVFPDGGLSSGPFILQPVLPRPTGEEPIIEVTK